MELIGIFSFDHGHSRRIGFDVFIFAGDILSVKPQAGTNSRRRTAISSMLL